MTANFTPGFGSAASAIPPISRAATLAAAGFTTSLAVGARTTCNSGCAITRVTKTAPSTQRNGRKTPSRRKNGLAPTVTGGCPKGRFESQLTSLHEQNKNARPHQSHHPQQIDIEPGVPQKAHAQFLINQQCQQPSHQEMAQRVCAYRTHQGGTRAKAREPRGANRVDSHTRTDARCI